MARCEVCIHAKVCAIKADKNTELEIKPCDHFEYDPKLSGRYIVALDELSYRAKLLSFDAVKSEIANLLSDLKKAVHDKAIYTYSKELAPYVNLKVFDAVIADYLRRLEEKKYG